MYLIWANVPVRVSRLLGFDAEAVFDPTGCDYLWTDYTVSLEGMWGRNADGYDLADLTPEGPVPGFLSGPLAAVASGVRSVVATRHALSQRAPFALYEVNVQTGLAEVLLASGGIDAANGPAMVEPPSVQSAHGSGGLVFVRLTFRVSVCDCPAFQELRGDPGRVFTFDPRVATLKVVRRVVGVPLRDAKKAKDAPETAEERATRRASEFAGGVGGPAVVGQGLQLLSLGGSAVLRSNRWTTSVGCNPANEAPEYRLVGQAIFRRDALQAVGVSTVDQFRGSLLPVMPANCVREINDVSVSGDGLTLAYDVTDRVQVRGYVDRRVKKTENGRVAAVGGAAVARNVAGVSLVSKREFSQPSLSRGLFDFIDNLATVNFANSEQDDIAEKAAEGADVIPVVGKEAQAAARAVRVGLNRVIAGFKTANNLLPTVVEGAVAEVRITREGTLADAQGLAFALVAGALDQVDVKALGPNKGNGRGDNGNLFGFRFFAVPPATSYSVECDHVAGVVRVSLQIEYSGLVDFLLGGQQTAAGRALRPLSDEIVGGRASVGIFNIIDALGLIGNIGALLGLQAAGDGVLKLADETVVNRFADELLITDADFVLRGPNGDSYSRATCDLLIRSAQLLLRPCQTPLAPANQELAPFPQVFVSEVVAQPPKDPPPGPKPGDKPAGTPDKGGGIKPPPDDGKWQQFLHGAFPIPVIRGG